ncbi:MAG TPA: hypothetical protein VIJ96_00700 [Acidothermaceae bacterium]
MIPARVDLDDEDTRLLTYKQALAAAVEHLDVAALVAADVSAMTAGPNVTSDIDPLVADRAGDDFGDDLADEVAYRAALTALSGVVQRSLRDFLS